MIQNKKSAIFNFLYQKAHRGNAFWRCLYGLYTQFVLGCDINPSTKIGTGFKIFHSAHASVVSPGTIIGNNVSLRQNTTIGAKGFDGAEKSPIIEDNVTIGPNVCIIGDITIGEGTIIGAGAVVVKDVPAHTIVVGNPAKVIKSTMGKDTLNKHKAGGGIKQSVPFPGICYMQFKGRGYGQKEYKKLTA
ncbi:serine O-acetyltransferase [Paraprevotella clara]|uniref:serine O-acetyltransferase n=3 Tax=Paraprevotella clara TaxID=454154 RepID=UPI00300E8D81